MFVESRFILNNETKDLLHKKKAKFGYDGFGELVFYRTYSRKKKDNSQENWADCVIRVVEGTFSIRKDWYVKNHINWDEQYWQDYAINFAISMFDMKWLPPGRGLWAMGSDFIYERGSMALMNCAATEIGEQLAEDIGWLMDCLMLGVGVGFSPTRNDNLKVYSPCNYPKTVIITDDREGWVNSVELLIKSFLSSNQNILNFNYDEIRPEGCPISTFGGIASGPDPLKKLHDQIRYFFQCYMKDPEYDSVMLKTDIANSIGCCIVAGNIRRSAELASLSIQDPIFKNLKDYDKYPYRKDWGWMSNNSVDLENDEDFLCLGEIAKSVVIRGEPGYKNLRNFPKGRIGKKDKIKKDEGRFVNPCQPKSALLLTKLGIRTLSQINIGDYIWSETGWTKVINKESQGIKKIYKYKTTVGNFIGTENHKVMCENQKCEIQYAYGIDVLKGPDYKKININHQLVMDGLVLGDGTITHGTVHLCIGLNDQDNFSELWDFIGSNYCDYRYEIHTDITPVEVGHTFNRYVPNRYMTGTPEEVASFLRGLYSANGSICGNRITLKATSFDIIENVQIMLSSLGIRSYYTTNKEKEVNFENGIYTCKQSYDLNITHDRLKFKENIGFIQKYKMNAINEKIPSKREKITFDIVENIYLGEEEVYDITVDNCTHTYWTNGLNVANCGEQILCSKELCTLSETCPTMCSSPEEWLQACEYATFYASTVTLLPTHRPETNRVMAKNRRIGVGIIDFIGWKKKEGVHKIINLLRKGYKKIRRVNRLLAEEAGIPESIRVTTVKPGGSIPKLPGITAGIMHPNFNYMIRRIRIQRFSPIHSILADANIPYEEDQVSANTDVFEYPTYDPNKTADKISLWEQAMNLVLLQREWSDNAVSNTLNFKPKWSLIKHLFVDKSLLESELRQYMPVDEIKDFLHYGMEHYSGEFKIVYDGESGLKIYEYNKDHEEDDIEPVLSMIAPLTKSVSLLPHTTKGVYAQMPEEGITKEEYELRKSKIKIIDWSYFSGSDGMDEKYCTGPACIIS